MEKVLKIVPLKEQGSDYAYWSKKSVQERLAAVELLRLHYINFTHNVQPRLQRVCTVIEKA